MQKLVGKQKLCEIHDVIIVKWDGEIKQPMKYAYLNSLLVWNSPTKLLKTADCLEFPYISDSESYARPTKLIVRLANSMKYVTDYVLLLIPQRTHESECNDFVQLNLNRWYLSTSQQVQMFESEVVSMRPFTVFAWCMRYNIVRHPLEGGWYYIMKASRALELHLEYSRT